MHWYFQATGMILKDMTYRDHTFQYRPLSPGSVSGNITLGVSHPSSLEYTLADLLPSERGKKARILYLFLHFIIHFFASLTLVLPFSMKILQSPFGRPSMHFIQDWGHMGLFIATEKRAKLTNIFCILFWWNQKAVIHCLLGQKVQVILKLGQNYKKLVLTNFGLCEFIVTSPRNTLWRLCCLLCVSQNLNTNTICWIHDSDKARIL